MRTSITLRHVIAFVALSIYLIMLFNLGLSYHAVWQANQQPKDAKLRFIGVNLSESVDTIVRDQAVLQNAEKIIEIARAVQDVQQQVIPRNSTVDFDPDKGDVAMPGGVYHNLDFKHSWERRKMPEDVHLTPDIEESIQKIIAQFAEQHRKVKETRVEEPLNIYTGKSHYAAWERWHNNITQYNLYQADDPSVDDVLRDLRTQDFIDVEEHRGGTQLKLIFTFTDGARAIFKPMRFPRNVETLPDHFVFADYERHVAEIAAFNLDRILGFHRVPPTTGRRVNVTAIKELVPKELERTFFVSPAGNKCLFGTCSYYCDSGHAVCGQPELLEGSMMAYLPSNKFFRRQSWEHPWKGTYSMSQPHARWENTPDYCSEVRFRPPYHSGRRMADLMDLAVFDYLQGNIDRHNFQIFEYYGNYTFNLHYDNGRGFGKSLYDNRLILAPVYQCCMFRYTTLKKLWTFYSGPESLSSLMRKALATDPVAPVLLGRHLTALDRRIKTILKTVHECIQQKGGAEKVMIVDGF